ncbi:flavodoxin family protein [Pseudoalteromonas sp. T1lg23B]|uniref:flavodoxin family protein n=1 Tax=Pseudoalteromonas sp. T1lg23B TaxID=2077097 RepID=UPI000CF6CDCD|nr:NAD(P)H-dependent oxidoreductase [Pseudoalteromonas sp. T1lg23B]
MRKTVILFSSANQTGNTYQLVKLVLAKLPKEQVKFIEIDPLTFSDYNYDNHYPQDDFYTIAQALEWADNIVFASPIYWHGVTSNMKRLIDRMTELTENLAVKHIGKGLKNKHGFVLTTSAHTHPCEVFTGFFERLFSYFDITHSGLVHAPCNEGFKMEQNEVAHLIAQLQAPHTVDNCKQAIA